MLAGSEAEMEDGSEAEARAVVKPESAISPGKRRT
jgi:hypothetical protein